MRHPAHLLVFEYLHSQWGEKERGDAPGIVFRADQGRWLPAEGRHAGSRPPRASPPQRAQAWMEPRVPCRPLHADRCRTALWCEAACACSGSWLARGWSACSMACSRSACLPACLPACLLCSVSQSVRQAVLRKNCLIRGKWSEKGTADFFDPLTVSE